VYGDAAFTEAYGEIEPIEGERVIEIPDGATLDLGSSQLEFIHTRGHARHHMVIYDTSSKSIFTGMRRSCKTNQRR
jgi:glyoxylase-like metal-dependent hydrolase (beta-lactamase superfamily II)